MPAIHFVHCCQRTRWCKACLAKATVTIMPSPRGFFHTLKTELTHHEKYETKTQAMESIFEYIELFFNRKRKHSTLGYETPVEYKLLRKAA